VKNDRINSDYSHNRESKKFSSNEDDFMEHRRHEREVLGIRDSSIWTKSPAKEE